MCAARGRERCRLAFVTPLPSPLPPMQAAIKSRMEKKAMEEQLAAPSLLELDATIVKEEGDAFLDVAVVGGNLRKLWKRLKKVETRTLNLKKSVGKVAGGPALCAEIEKLQGTISGRVEEWTGWSKVPLPGGGVGISRLEALKKLWEIWKAATESFDSCAQRAAELRAAGAAAPKSLKRPRKGGAGAGVKEAVGEGERNEKKNGAKKRKTTVPRVSVFTAAARVGGGAAAADDGDSDNGKAEPTDSSASSDASSTASDGEVCSTCKRNCGKQLGEECEDDFQRRKQKKLSKSKKPRSKKPKRSHVTGGI